MTLSSYSISLTLSSVHSRNRDSLQTTHFFCAPGFATEEKLYCYTEIENVFRWKEIYDSELMETTPNS